MLLPILISYNQGQSSWDKFAFVFFFSNHTCLNSPPTHRQSWTRVSGFSRVSTFYRVSEGRTARHFRRPEITENYEYCIIVPGTFVLDCRWSLLCKNIYSTIVEKSPWESFVITVILETSRF